MPAIANGALKRGIPHPQATDKTIEMLFIPKGDIYRLAAKSELPGARGSRIPTPSGEQEMTVINESGLYSLVLSSKLPGAKKFWRWVTAEEFESWIFDG